VPKKSPMRIGFDIDDVLFKTGEHAAPMYNDAFGTAVTINDWYDLSLLETYGVTTKQEAFARVNQIFKSEEFITTVPPMDGMQQLVRKLSTAVELLVAVTGRPHTTEVEIRRMLELQYPKVFDARPVFFTDHLQQLGSDVVGSKLIIAQQEGLTHFVDDHPDHVNLLAEAGIHAVLFGDYRWNRVEVHPSVVRARDVEELEKYFDAERYRLAA
jgi:uncharacterized HAD superfamily protein